MRRLYFHFLRGVVLAVLALAGLQAQAQAYPSKPIRVIVPFSVGSATDITTRLIGAKMTESWGQQVVVDNRPGAGGIIAAEAARRAPADGYTLFFASSTIQAANPSLFLKLPYDPVKDFTPVAPLVEGSNVLVVNPSLGVSSVKELIQLAKTQPGKLNFAYSSSLSRVDGEGLKFTTGIDIVGVPYKSNPNGVTDLIAGHISMAFTDLPSSLPHIRTGKLRALGYSSGKRSTLLPDIPTMAEAGVPGYGLTGWAAAFAPAGTPDDVVAKLNAEINRILNLPDIRERLTQQGLDPALGTSAQLGALVRSEIPKWAKAIKEAGIKPE